MSKSIYRTRRTSNFTTIPNEVLNDQAISWKAKGILIYLLSKPDDWEPMSCDIAKQSTDGIASVYSGINELCEAGYIWKRPRGGENVGGWEYFVSDVVVATSPFLKEPNCDNADSAKSNATKYLSNVKPNTEDNNAARGETSEPDLFPQQPMSGEAEPSERSDNDTTPATSHTLRTKPASSVAKARHRLCRMFNRKPSLVWSAKEEAALKKVMDTDEEDWLLLEDYYKHEGENLVFLRTGIITLLNNWSNDIGWAMKWRNASKPKEEDTTHLFPGMAKYRQR